MAAVWGINRSMAEIQGLLYITGQTLCTDDIMAKLHVSRGSVSMALRALLEWGVVRKVRRRGDRREYFESLDNVWEIFSKVALRRKRREIDPIVQTLKQCQRSNRRSKSTSDPEASQVRDRLDQMVAFLAIMEEISRRFIESDDGIAKAVEILIERDREKGRTSDAAEGLAKGIALFGPKDG